jgi:hypothetical protein
LARHALSRELHLFIECCVRRSRADLDFANPELLVTVWAPSGITLLLVGLEEGMGCRGRRDRAKSTRVQQLEEPWTGGAQTDGGAER